MRIYINVDEREFKHLEVQASSHNLTVSSYCKCKLLNIPFDSGVERMIATVKNLKSGETFFISDLYDEDEWKALSRSMKLTLAQQLALKVKDGTLNVETYRVRKGYPTEYRKQ